MLTYITAFIFYTLAMIGVLLAGFVIYKKFMLNPSISSKSTIKVVDSCPIGAKKTLLIVKIKDEKFLIASGAEHTTFLAKLETNAETLNKETPLQNEPIKNNFSIENLLETVKQITESKKVQNEIKFTQPKNEITINDINTNEPQETRVDELKAARAQKFLNMQKKQQKQQKLRELQKQFMELYNEDEEQKDEIKPPKTTANRKVLNRILQELNSKNNIVNDSGR